MLQISLNNATSTTQLSTTLESTMIENDQAKEQEQEYWTTGQAANILGKSERTIRRLLQTGALDGYKYAGPNGMVWRVKPVENTLSVSQDVVNDLISEYQAKEEQIESLNQKIKDLEDRLSHTSALYEKAIHALTEFEKKTAPNAEQTKQPDVKTSWWNLFKLPGALKTANASDLI